MAGVISDLKLHARTLHRQILAGEPGAVTRVQRHFPELSDDDADALVRYVRRRHCLSVLARELGFRGWQHAVAAMAGGTASGRHTIARFVIGRGHVVSENRIRSDACDRRLMGVAHGALARLRNGEAEVVVDAPDGSDIAIGLGSRIDFDLLSRSLERVSATTREQFLARREAIEEKQRATVFRVKIAERFEPYFLVPRESADLSALAGMYGALSGSFIGSVLPDQRGNPEVERDLTSPVRREQFVETAAGIVRSAPAFVCSGGLTGFSAAFADCFAIVMLSEVKPSKPAL
jgi:hypothetical protein